MYIYIYIYISICCIHIRGRTWAVQDVGVQVGLVALEKEIRLYMIYISMYTIYKTFMYHI